LTPLLAPGAQVAFVGFAVQALVTRQGPIEGLTAHIGSGGAKNITYYLTHLPETLAA
jgi:light-harvesting complex I chlorophyll a/b binding protein 5